MGESKNVSNWGNTATFGITFEGFLNIANLLAKSNDSFGIDMAIITVNRGVYSEINPLTITDTSNNVFIQFYIFSMAVNKKVFFSSIDVSSILFCPVCTENYWKFPLRDTFPLRPCTINKREYLCPRESVSWLNSWYGEVWQKKLLLPSI
jgi:hypothetical protein